MQLASSPVPPCRPLRISAQSTTTCQQAASGALQRTAAVPAKPLRTRAVCPGLCSVSGNRSAVPAHNNISYLGIRCSRCSSLARRVTVFTSSGRTTDLLRPSSSSDQLSGNHLNSRTTSTSHAADAGELPASTQLGSCSDLSPAPASLATSPTSNRPYDNSSNIVDVAYSSSSSSNTDDVLPGSSSSTNSSSNQQQPPVRYSAPFGGGPGINNPAVPPAGLSSISSYDDEEHILHVQALEQEQTLVLTASSSSAGSQQTVNGSIDAIVGEYQQQNGVAGDMQQQPQQQEIEWSALQPGTTSTSGGNDALDAAIIMSFMEEDISSLETMYDVISRASVVVHQQVQQQKITGATSLQQGQPQEEQLQPTDIGQISNSSSSSLSSQDIAAIAELQTATEKKLVELQHAVEELQLGEEATQQLTDVLHKLEQLEQDLSAAVHHSSSSSLTSADTAVTAVVDTLVDSAAAAAAAVAIDSPPTPPMADIAVQRMSSSPPAAAEVATEPETAVTVTQDMEAPTAAAVTLQPVATAATAAPQATATTGAAHPAATGSLAVAHTLEMEAFAASAVIGGASAPAPELLAPSPTAAAAAATAPAPAPTAADSTVLWPLFVLGLSYVHQATSGFALPALLPMVSPDLNLTDFQGALLTSGYSYLYALALVPVGLLADKLERPKLLAVGLALWSTLSIVSSGAKSFGELLIARTGFAIAQAAQNPVSFSLIPDLFPANKSTALAAYNCAIYLGRALSFASVLAAHRVGTASRIGGKLPAVGTMADAAAGNAGDEGVALSMVPLDALDLQRMSIIYTTGDMAAVTPLYNYNFHVIAYEAVAGGSEGWRQLLTWIGYPGFAIALLMWLTVREPRNQDQQQQQQRVTAAAADGMQSNVLSNTSAALRDGAAKLSTQIFSVATGHGWHGSSSNSSSSDNQQQQPKLAGPACVMDSHLQQPVDAAADRSSASTPVAEGKLQETPVQISSLAALSASDNPVLSLLKIKPFQATTIAAALNDVGSYSLIAWHSTFYERVFGLDSGVYAPMLAVILPVGGILGGVGGGLIADWLSVVGGRYWLTAGASLLAAPFIAQSLLAHTPAGSFTALLAGFALSEAWRAPGAIMIRSVAPQELGSTASALYLCIRNLIGGFGPVAVAKLAELVGLQHAMLLAPACYVASGLIFYIAEKEIEDLQKQQNMLLPEAKQ